VFIGTAANVGLWHTFAMRADDPNSKADIDTSDDEIKADDNPSEDGVSPKEIGGRDGLDPTRYGDWEKAGRCIDF
jgi:hypothetical protein